MSDTAGTITLARSKAARRMVEPSSCAQCGMVLNGPREYHPFAACILMEHYRNGNDVRTVLEGMRDYFAEGGSLDDISTRSRVS